MATRDFYRFILDTAPGDNVTDLQWDIAEGVEKWPDADVAEIERIAAEAQRLAEEEEKTGIEEGYPYSACQESYGCDWCWEDDEEPRARVFDCDGNTLDSIE